MLDLLHDAGVPHLESASTGHIVDDGQVSWERVSGMVGLWGTAHDPRMAQGSPIRCSQISLRRMNQGVNGGL